MESGGVKLVLWIQTSSISVITRSCKCFPHMSILALPRWSALLPYLEFYIYLFFLALKKSYKVDNKVKSQQGWGSRDRDRMVHNYLPITTNLASSNPANGEVYSIQHYVIQFVSDLRQVIEMPVLNQKSEWSCIFVLGYRFWKLWTFWYFQTSVMSIVLK
jgi:hypothetical protein